MEVISNSSSFRSSPQYFKEPDLITLRYRGGRTPALAKAMVAILEK
jgi:hypothetical protein